MFRTPQRKKRPRAKLVDLFGQWSDVHTVLVLDRLWNISCVEVSAAARRFGSAAGQWAGLGMAFGETKRGLTRTRVKIDNRHDEICQYLLLKVASDRDDVLFIAHCGRC
jgi:hypothetical protein